MKYYLILVLFLLTCCNSDNTNTSELQAGIFSAGELNPILVGNQRDEVVKLGDYSGQAALYGLGVLKDVNGLCFFWEGELSTCTFKNGQLRCSDESTKGAAMLAYISQPDWQEILLPDEINALPDLERFLLQNKTEWGVQSRAAFAIKMETTFPVLQWHVPFDPPVSGKIADYRNSGTEGDFDGVRSQVFGFFSNAHQGKFIHQGSLMNIYAKEITSNRIGQVKKMTIPTGTKIWIAK